MSTPEEPWTIGRLLSWTVDYLGRHGAENPRLDAEVLLAEARGCRRIDLYAAYGEPAADEVRTAFRELVRRRAAGTPVAYLVGRREFYALEFEVTPDVLIPRPETELLVVALLDYVKQRAAGEEEGRSIRIADVGTGSGVLAVCAAKCIRHVCVTAIDISAAALAVARRNAQRHGVEDRIEFVESDLFASLPAERAFDYIVSNPPYVSTAEMANLAPHVRNEEPHVALHAGERGTEVIERLIQQAAQRLTPGGAVLIEVSPMK
jgi:release factor glutamine methyltransferase